jgi:hypothetical protein
VGDSQSDTVDDLPTDGEDADGAGVEAWVDTIIDNRSAERPKELPDKAGAISLESLHCSYARAKMTTSSRVASCWRATSVRRGSPRPVMKCLENSSTMPVCQSVANSPMGLSVRGGPNRVFTSCTMKVVFK